MTKAMKGSVTIQIILGEFKEHGGECLVYCGVVEV